MKIRRHPLKLLRVALGPHGTADMANEAGVAQAALEVRTRGFSGGTGTALTSSLKEKSLVNRKRCKFASVK